MIVGHVWDIHVMLYGNSVMFHAASLIYPVHDSLFDIVLVLFVVRSSQFHLYGNVASSLLSDHVIVNSTFQLVHQFVSTHEGYVIIISHVGPDLSIFIAQLDVHVSVLPALSFGLEFSELLSNCTFSSSYIYWWN